jgi:hypothetical protein
MKHDIQIVLDDSIYDYWIVRDQNPERSKWYNSMNGFRNKKEVP